jgi:hypothetical protein
MFDPLDCQGSVEADNDSVLRHRLLAQLAKQIRVTASCSDSTHAHSRVKRGVTLFFLNADLRAACCKPRDWLDDQQDYYKRARR